MAGITFIVLSVHSPSRIYCFHAIVDPVLLLHSTGLTMAQDQVCALTHDGECTGECKTRKLKIVKMCLVIYMSHFSYTCKMRCPLNLVLESWKYLWFYSTFWIAILDCGLKLHKLSIHTLVMLQK